nr:hypothetical protein CFP56_33803 [Quercus suber]
MPSTMLSCCARLEYTGKVNGGIGFMNSNVLKDPSKILRVLPWQFARLFSAEHLAFEMAFLNLSMINIIEALWKFENI